MFGISAAIGERAMHSNQVFEHPIDGTVMTCVTIGPQSMELPSYLLQGQKACGYLSDGKTLSKWYWKGLSVVDGQRCIYFDQLPLFPFSELATSKRSQALELVQRLAQTLMVLEKPFLDLSSGILPLWRIWGVQDGRILILPQDLADLFASCAEEPVRFFNSGAWVHHGIHPPFSLCDQLTSLLYYAASGFPPFLASDTREDGFRAIPLATMQLSSSKGVVDLIDRSLSMTLTKQRDAAGNLESQKALGWFLEQLGQVQWDFEDITEERTPDSYRNIPGFLAFFEAQHKRAARRIFWRKKGVLIVAITVTVFFISYFTVQRVQASLAPPYTAGMQPIEIVQEFYAGQNSLDLQKMEASLAKGTKNPASMEVTNLFVTRQTRQAYEGINTQMDPNEWIAQGKPAIMEGTFLYGVTDLEVQQLTQDTFQAKGVLYTPYSYEETEPEETAQGTVPIHTYRVSQVFTVEMGKRGWYEITEIGSSQVEYLEKLVIPTYARNANTALLPQ